MASSGIKLASEAKTTLRDMKTVTNAKYSAIILQFNEKATEVVVVGTLPVDEKNPLQRFEEMVIKEQDKVFYAAINVKYHVNKGSKNEKVYLVGWVPDNFPVRQRMLGASTFQSLFGEVGQEITGIKRADLKEQTDFEAEEMLDKLGLKEDVSSLDGRPIEGRSPNRKYCDSE